MNWLPFTAALVLTASAAGATPQGNEHEPATDPVPQAAPVAEVPLYETIEMQAERYRRLTVPVTIMGEGPFRFMVDTGAQATVLSTALAEQLQLFDRESATLVGMASSRVVQTTMVPDFSLGTRSFVIRTAPIVEGAHIGGADGILGLDSLQDQRVLIDFEHGELTVADSDSSRGTGGYEIVVRARERLGQLIIHRARIDGVRTSVIIDTGATGSIGNPALQQRLSRRRTLMDDAVMTDVNGVQITGETRIVGRLEMGRMQLANIPVSFADSPTFRALNLADEPALILGMSELRMFRRVAIDFRTRRVLFDMPDGSLLGDGWNFNERATRL
ncbi:MAG: aspartyl protease family protein [Erythrobacter sp.]|nr:MAG: aspartyl protease family protein [Erythrobacter sp.]